MNWLVMLVAIILNASPLALIAMVALGACVAICSLCTCMKLVIQVLKGKEK